jgi:hypothetical protein
MVSGSDFDFLRRDIEPLSRFIDIFSKTLTSPAFCKSETQYGFRFKEPNFQHFLLLRGVRIVSALHASIELAKKGYTQEIAVLLRTQIEYTTQIDFVLTSRDTNGNFSKEAQDFIESYFQDAHRPSLSEIKKPKKLIQKKVHEIVGARHDRQAAEAGIDIRGRKPADELMSNVYLIFSNYVHGRYPESMDLFGGKPGRFHLSGMSGTPKDQENVEILKTLILSASNCFKGIVHDLRLYDLVRSDKILLDWLNK